MKFGNSYVKKFCWYLKDCAFEGTRIFTWRAAPSFEPPKPPKRPPRPALEGYSFG